MNYVDYKSKYVALSGFISRENDMMNGVMFLSAVGACFHKHGITARFGDLVDLRAHSFLEQDSRSGKGEAIKSLVAFSKGLGLDITQELTITDAAVIGTVDGQISQKIREKGLFPGHPDFKDPRTIGSFGLYDMVIFPEAQQMFQSGPYTKDLVNAMQVAMDNFGKMYKNLAGNFKIDCYCNATFVGTTYKLKELPEILVKKGIFQRMLVIIRNFPIEKRGILNEQIIESSREETSADETFEKLKKLGDEIRKIAEKNKNRNYRLSESGVKFMKRENREKIDWIKEDFSGSDLELVSPFTTSILSYQLKLGCIAAVFNGTKEIGARELKQTKFEVDYYFKSIVTKMLNRVSTGKYDYVRKEVLNYIGGRRGQKVKRAQLEEHLITKMHITNNKVKSVINQMKKNKEIIIDRKNKEIKLRK